MDAVAASHALPAQQQATRVTPARPPRAAGTASAASTPDLPQHLRALAARCAAIRNMQQQQRGVNWKPGMPAGLCRELMSMHTL